MLCKVGLLQGDESQPPGVSSSAFPIVVHRCRKENALFMWGVAVATLSKLQSQNPSLASPHRFGITRPSNECHLLPSDLVFCAIPFNTTCGKSDSSPSIQAQNNSTNATTPLAQGSNFFDSHHADESHDLYPVDDTGERWSQHHHSRVYPLDTLDASDIVQEK